MTGASTATPGLAPEQLDELRLLLEGADGVELKLTVPDRDQRPAVKALGIDPLSAQLRQVFFFDTPDLTLHQQGVILRARRTKKGERQRREAAPRGPERGLPRAAKPGRVRRRSRFHAGRVRVLRDPRRQQRSFLEQSVPGSVVIDELSILGPVTVLKLKFTPQGYEGKLVAELWQYPDGSRILELSTKAATSEAFEVAARTRQFLEQRGVDLSGEQQTKTRTALEYFAAELR